MGIVEFSLYIFEFERVDPEHFQPFSVLVKVFEIDIDLC